MRVSAEPVKGIKAGAATTAALVDCGCKKRPSAVERRCGVLSNSAWFGTVFGGHSRSIIIV
jgi:hypothetical protein